MNETLRCSKSLSVNRLDFFDDSYKIVTELGLPRLGISFLSILEKLREIGAKSICCENIEVKKKNFKRISFFSGGKLRGYCIIEFVKNNSNVYEAVLEWKSSGMLYFRTEANVEIQVENEKHKISGIYFCEKNNETSVCTHSAIKSLWANGLGITTLTNEQINGLTKFPPREITNREIPNILKKLAKLDNFVIGETLSLHKCNEDLLKLYKVLEVSCGGIFLISCEKQSTESRVEGHAISVIGHTYFKYNWSPYAEVTYKEKSNLSSHIYHKMADFLICDDNICSLSALSAQYINDFGNIQFIPIFRYDVNDHFFRLPDAIQGGVIEIFETYKKDELSAEMSAPLNNSLELKDYVYVRTILMTKVAYIDRLCHCGEKKPVCSKLSSFPDLLWVTEFSKMEDMIQNQVTLEVVSNASPNITNLQILLIADFVSKSYIIFQKDSKPEYLKSDLKLKLHYSEQVSK